MRITHSVQDVFDALVEEIRSAWERYVRVNFSRLYDPAEALGEEIKVMLGRGDISHDQYDQLNRKLRDSSLGRGDLELLRRQARKPEHKQVIKSEEPAITERLNRLYIRIASLEDARREAELALEVLKEDLKRVQEFASLAEEMARKTLPDESEARALLEIRQNMLERMQALESNRRELEQGMRRLEILQGELYAREAELKALGAQAAIARSEYRGWEGMLNQSELGMLELHVQSKSERNKWR